jgi:hypothetical protein
MEHCVQRCIALASNAMSLAWLKVLDQWVEAMKSSISQISYSSLGLVAALFSLDFLAAVWTSD